MLYLQLSNSKDKVFLLLLLKICRLFCQKADKIEMCHIFQPRKYLTPVTPGRKFCYQFCNLNFDIHVCVDTQFIGGIRQNTGNSRSSGRAGVSKVLREMQTCKKQKLLHHYVCFCSAAMLTLKIITESVGNHSECCGCVNSCNKFISARSC